DGLVSMAASDKVAIVLDDDTFHWTTIATVDSTTQITLSVATTGAASSGNLVYAYTNDLARPLRIIDVRRRDESSDQDTPIIVQSHEEYQRLPNKLIDGETNIVYYHPEHRNARGTVHLWPRPSTVARTMRMSCMLPLQDFDASGNNADLPTEWLDTIVWNLAKRLLPNAWFERSIAELGQSMGVTATGLLLLRLVDPSEACFLPPIGEVTMLATPVSQEPDAPRIVVAH
ncbi:hypothetical protein LCGC14_2339950, partial [marine sediment metagenome]